MCTADRSDVEWCWSCWKLLDIWKKILSNVPHIIVIAFVNSWKQHWNQLFHKVPLWCFYVEWLLDALFGDHLICKHLLHYSPMLEQHVNRTWTVSLEFFYYYAKLFLLFLHVFHRKITLFGSLFICHNFTDIHLNFETHSQYLCYIVTWCLYIISLCYIFNLHILTSCGVFRIH